MNHKLIARNRSLIDGGFVLLIEGLAPFVDSVMSAQKGLRWDTWLSTQDKKGGFFEGKRPNSKTDPRTLFKALGLPELAKHWHAAGLGPADLKRASRLHNTRNQLAHYHPKFERVEVALNALLNIEALLNAVGGFNLANQVRDLMQTYRSAVSIPANDLIPAKTDFAENESGEETAADLPADSQSDQNGSFASILQSDDAIAELLLEAARKANTSFPQSDPNRAQVVEMLYLLNDYKKRQLWFDFDEAEIVALIRGLWLYVYSWDVVTAVLPDGPDFEAEGIVDDAAMVVNYYHAQLKSLISKWKASGGGIGAAV